MKSLAFLLSFIFSLSTVAADKPLRSSQIRADICSVIGETFYEDGLDLEEMYEVSRKEETSILPNFQQVCEQAQKSFKVIDSVYNPKAKKIVELQIQIEFEMVDYVTVSGSIQYARTAFDPKTGEVKLGDWISSQEQIKYQLQDKALSVIARAIVREADIHNGDARVENFDLAKYSLDEVLKKLDENTAEFNQQSQEDKDPEDQGEACTLNPATEHGEGMFFEGELGFENGPAVSLYKLLKERGQILDVVGVESAIWREDCAFYNVYIYLKNGQLIVLNYDKTT